jgi:ketosteroid isomerase-like protein
MGLRDDDPLAWLVACEEIRQLASRYAVLLDARDLDALVELFVPDVRVGGDLRGRRALRDRFAEQLRGLGRSILVTGNHVIDVVDTDHATGIVSCRGEIEPLDAPGTWVVQQIQYHDRYERRDGRWLFVRRHHLLWYGADLLQRPVDLPEAHWPAAHTGKGELPEWYPSWRAWAAPHPEQTAARPD